MENDDMYKFLKFKGGERVRVRNLIGTITGIEWISNDGTGRNRWIVTLDDGQVLHFNELRFTSFICYEDDIELLDAEKNKKDG